MKNIVYILGLVTVGFILYKLTQSDESNETIITDPQTNTYLQTQPQQQFPMQTIVDPRVDNADQPWYGGDRSFMGVVTDSFNEFPETSSKLLTYGTMWNELDSQYSTTH